MGPDSHFSPLMHPERVPRFSPLDCDRTGQRMNFASIDLDKIINSRVRPYSTTAGIKTIKLNNVTQLYLDLRRQVTVPI